MDVDPIASLRATETIITLGGQDYTIPAAHAGRWLEILLAPNGNLELTDIIPGMLDEDVREGIEEALWTQQLSGEEVTEVALEVITTVGGRPWWWVTNIVMLAKARWPQIYGALLLQGVNIHQLPLGAALDSLYSLFTRGLNEDKHREFDRLLETSPTGEQPELNEDAESANFLAMANGGF